MAALTASPQLPFEGKTVLVADDDPVIREYLSARCKEIGLRVETAADGLRALLKASKLEPDLLILDLHLPDVKGFRVCERLTDPKFQPLPVVILTADSGEETKRRCERRQRPLHLALLRFKAREPRRPGLFSTFWAGRCPAGNSQKVARNAKLRREHD